MTAANATIAIPTQANEVAGADGEATSPPLTADRGGVAYLRDRSDRRTPN